MPRPTRLLALATLLAAACTEQLTGPASDLETARRRWARAEPAAYEMTVRNLCFCVPDVTAPVVVTVRGGVVQSRRYAPGSALAGTEVGAQYARLFPSVDGIFEVVDDALQRRAASINATYDAARGYPVSLFVDYDTQLADEERGYQIDGFRALP